MADVDAILASGGYTDRKGRTWRLRTERTTGAQDTWDLVGSDGPEWVLGDDMRTLIERDLHRDECPGLYACLDHPVPTVWASRTSRLTCFAVTVGSDWGIPRRYQTFEEAIAAAHNMTGETP